MPNAARLFHTARILATLAPVVAVAALATPAVASTACSSSSTPGGTWPSYGHDLTNTRTQPSETTLSPASLTREWVFSTTSAGDSAGVFNSTPVVADGCVFAGSGGGFVYALDEHTGSVKWQRKIDVPSPGFGGAIVGAPEVSGGRVFVLVNKGGGPYAVALDEHTGALVWQSAPVTTQADSFTNASAAIFNGLLFFGFSPPDSPTGQGGFALIDTTSGNIVDVTPTIPPADQAQGFSGGGIYSTPAFDSGGQFAYVGTAQPHSPQQHPNTDAILKIDMNRSSSTFGQIVAHFNGNPEQFTSSLQSLSQTPACQTLSVSGAPLEVVAIGCGQLNLDFAASPNLFTDASGQALVGDLQKSGVYWAAHADSMAVDWGTQVGFECRACNGASGAFYGNAIYDGASPGSTEFALNRTTGGPLWEAPLGDEPHFESTSVANGVVYTLDGFGFLDAFDATNGHVLLHRQTSTDTGAPTGGPTSSGVAIADHAVFVATAQQPGLGTPGYIIAYH
ncbi:MAG: PQQ-binding-like beta-propeller repeat protein [Gaiellaceae bacterium]